MKSNRVQPLSKPDSSGLNYSPPGITNNTNNRAQQALLQTQLDQSSWTTQHDKLLKEWKTRAFVEFYLQVYSLYTYQSYYNYLSVPMVLLSTIAGASIFSSSNAVVRYIAASMAMASAILSGLMRQIQPGERSTQHYTYAQRWNNLIRNIQQILHLPYQQRPKVDLYLAQLASEMDAIDSSQPYPAVRAINTFMRRFGRRNLDKFLYGEDIVNSIYTTNTGPTAYQEERDFIDSSVNQGRVRSIISTIFPKRRSMEIISTKKSPRIAIPTPEEALEDLDIEAELTANRSKVTFNEQPSPPNTYSGVRREHATVTPGAERHEIV